MKRIDRYLLAESLPPLLFGALLYSTLAVVSMTIPRLQWVVGVPLRELSAWLLLQFPAALVQTLPIAMVLAVLLAFGRLAMGNELLAMQAGALPLRRIARIFVVLGLAATLLALSLNQWVLPEANSRVGSLYWRITAGGSGLFRLASQSLPLGGFSLTFEQIDRRNDTLTDVRIERWDGRNVTVVFAESAEFVDRGLRLYDYRTVGLDLGALDSEEADADELLGRLVRVDSRGGGEGGSLLLTLSTTPEELITRFSGGGFEDPRSLSEAYRAARDPALPAGERLEAEVLFHRKLAEPFASVVLLLLAVPLSLAYARSRSVAFGLSLVVTLAWYLLLTLGQLLAQTGDLPVWVGSWLPNLVLGACGLFLLSWRVAPR